MAHHSRPASDDTLSLVAALEETLPDEPCIEEALPVGSPQAVADFVHERADFLVRAAWVARTSQVRLQAAIDHWDRSLAEAACADLLAYLERWAELIGIVRAAGGIGEYLPFEEHGLDLARELDMGLLNQRTEDGQRDHAAVLSSLLQTLRCDWWRGIPQLSAAEAPPHGGGEPEDVVDRVRARCEALLDAMHGPEPEHDALDPHLDEKLDDALHHLGATPISSTTLPDRDIIYEFFAHRFAYRPYHPEVADTLSSLGYSPNYLRYRTKSGLDFFILEPASDVRPVIVFRGTEPDDLKDLKTDLEFQIGAEHFASAQRLGLRALLVACRVSTGYAPDLCGHSLGGALAQLTAAEWPDLVGDVVTFQAPGLTRLHAFRGEAGLNRHRPCPTAHPRVTHYIAAHDLVHKAGQRHLPGRTVIAVGVQLNRAAGIHTHMGHSDMLLGTHGQRKRLQRIGLEAHWTPHTYAHWGELAEHPTTRGSLHEGVRATVALSLELIQAWLTHPEDPGAVVRLIPELARQAVGDMESTHPAIALRIAKRLAKDSVRAMGYAVEMAARDKVRRGRPRRGRGPKR